MKAKISLLTGLLLTLASLFTLAQVPDPRDSVILESKAAASGFHPGTTDDTAAYLYLRVWITNKDSIIKFGLALQEKSLVGGGYMTLSWPRTFDGAVVPLTNTLTVRNIMVDNYHSNSPDSFDIRTNVQNLADVEPPNASRKPFWDIKFDTVFEGSGPGVIEFDTVINEYFTILVQNSSNNPVYMNFVKSIVSILVDNIHEVNDGIIPKNYSLSQNYPNPFNANTQITFALPKSGHAILEVFNILGQKVNTLVNGYLSAGTKIVNWDGQDDKGMPVPSGVYFYQLRSVEFKETKKMLVLK